MWVDSCRLRLVLGLALLQQQASYLLWHSCCCAPCLQAIVAADAQLLELLVGMAADEVDAAEAAAAAAAEAEASSEGGGGGSADSPASPSHSSTPSEPCSEVCLGTEGSRRALACLLLRSMARSAYITATPGPAAAFLRRFASLAVGPQADQSCAWFAQRLLLPVLRLLAVLSPDQDWVRWRVGGYLSTVPSTPRLSSSDPCNLTQPMPYPVPRLLCAPR